MQPLQTHFVHSNRVLFSTNRQLVDRQSRACVWTRSYLCRPLACPLFERSPRTNLRRMKTTTTMTTWPCRRGRSRQHPAAADVDLRQCPVTFFDDQRTNLDARSQQTQQPVDLHRDKITRSPSQALSQNMPTRRADFRFFSPQPYTT